MNLLSCAAFAADRAAAAAFLNGVEGSILHQLGRFSAANYAGFHPGHVVIPVDRHLAFGVQARFVPSPLLSRVGGDDHDRMFARIGGTATEWFFYHLYNPDRSGPEAYSFRRHWPHRLMNPDDHLEIMTGAYMYRVRAMEADIRENYERIRAYAEDESYRLGAFHVIPTSALKPHRPRSERQARFERRLTEGRLSRRLALLRTTIVLRW